MLMALCHSQETGWVEIDDVSKISDLRADDRSMVWGEADMNDLEAADVNLIAEEFSLDPLAVEDAVTARQRPKLEAFDKHHFAVLHQLYELDHQLEKRQISCFVGKDYVLVIHEGARDLIDKVKKRLSSNYYAESGPSYVLHALLDEVVDEYETLADDLEEDIERVEERVVGEARRRIHESDTSARRRHEEEQTQLQLYSVKQQVARLRRYALPLGRVLQWLVEGSGREFLPPETRTLFRDIHDHTLRITDQVLNVDALAAAVLDLARSQQSEELNKVNKKLTGWAAIFAVPTVIAGIYGMNFQLLPQEGSLVGFWVALALMVLSSTALYRIFKGKDWL